VNRASGTEPVTARWNDTEPGRNCLRICWVPLFTGVCFAASAAAAEELRAGALLWASDPASVSILRSRVDDLSRSGELLWTRTQPDEQFPGRTHRRLDQQHRGLRVFGGQLVQQLEADRVLTITGKLHSDVSVDVTPRFGSDDAVRGAAKPGEHLVGPVELIVLPLTDRYALAYSFRLRGPASLEAVYVDAHSGRTLLRYSDLRTQGVIGRGTGAWNDVKKMSVEQGTGGYRASDRLRPANIKTYDVNYNFTAWNRYALTDASLATDADNDWADGSVVDAHAYSGWVYDYFYKRFGRRGLDGKDLVAVSYVHFLPFTARNNIAFFDPVNNSMNYGDGDGSTFNVFSSALDVVAHELTHAVTEFTSNLIYLNEPGALNEAFSDIIGTAVEFYHEPSGSGRQNSDWLVGEDLFYGFGRVIRSMSNPGAVGDPDHYSKLCRPPVCTPNPEGDNGGVHINSGIVNQAFYLLVEGGTNRTSGLRVNGLGRSRIDRAEAIFYRAFTLYLTPTSGFSAARVATIQSARDLFGAGSVEEQQVIAAWTAVGVN